MDPFWAAVLDAIGKLGALGLAVYGLWQFTTGRLRSGSVVEADTKDLKEDRDAWKKLALDTGPEVRRLNDLLNTTLNLLLDSRRQPPVK